MTEPNMVHVFLTIAGTWGVWMVAVTIGMWLIDVYDRGKAVVGTE